METSRAWAALGLASVGTVLGAVLAGPAGAQVTQRVSVSSSGVQGNQSSFVCSISADGRYVAFVSNATNLVEGDTNLQDDVFVRDRVAGTTERVSVSSSGDQQGPGSYGFYSISISADGRFVVFDSGDFHLAPGDTNGWADIFLRDRQLGTTELVSIDSSGTQGNGESTTPSISADGRFVAFRSAASNLVPGDTNGHHDVFVRDLQTGQTELASVATGGAQADDQSFGPSLSADGRYVAFWSVATNLVPGDTNNSPDVFVRDRNLGTTERVSVHSDGTQGNGISNQVSISADGTHVVFSSTASNLVAGDTNGSMDVFVRNLALGTTERVSVDSGGAEGNASSGAEIGGISISPDGQSIAFESFASNLVPGDTNGLLDVFVRDRQLGTTERVSVDSAGAQGTTHISFACSITADARRVAFLSFASDLVPEDTNGASDVFVRDLDGGPAFTSLCDPGVGGVVACPCANSPSGPGRGCDNSSATGGAVLSASGGTSLSSDSLVFTTSGEKPTALSIVAQWTGANPTGAYFGQGVRCTSGALKRLFTKSASGGSITAPEFGVGDLQVSVRSAALGDSILSGQSRWYFVYYRDPMVLGGCPATSTFNATQTGEVVWSP